MNVVLFIVVMVLAAGDVVALNGDVIAAVIIIGDAAVIFVQIL